MSTWVARMRSRFEKSKQPERRGDAATSAHPPKGIVQLRKTFYEGAFGKSNSTDSNNSESSSESFEDESEVWVDINVQSNTKGGSNLERTPSNVVNQDNLCIYQDPDSKSVFGSFRKRPKMYPSVPDSKMSENDIIMRLKAGENEFKQIKRYESILRPPLYQQVVFSKHQSELQNTNLPNNQKKNSIVASMIEKYTEKSSVEGNQENQIDMDLLTSLRKGDKSSNTPEHLASILLQMKSNKNIKWVETEQVRSRNLAANMTPEEIEFQESQFELITSEASYNRSLGVLVDKFYNSPEMSLTPTNTHTPIIKAHQKMHLFSNILKIYDVSSKFLAELESKFLESIRMTNLFDIVMKYANNEFDVYVPYLQNQMFQSEAYNELKKDPEAAKVIEELEKQPECCFLTLDSFLLLPMQRLLRILLLLNAIKKRVPERHKDILEKANNVIKKIEEIVQKCSDKVDYIGERKRIIEILNCLVLKPHQKKLKSSLGTLIHEGDVRRSSKNQSKRLLPNFLVFRDYWFILTSQYFLMTKISKQSKEISYNVDDFCERSAVFVDYESLEEKDEGFEFKLIIQKSETTSDVYIVQTRTKEERQRWTNLLSDTGNE